MNEQDRQRVDFARKVVCSDLTQDLIAIINRLDKQLTKIVEVGEPLLKDIEVYASILQQRLCCYRSVQGPGLEPSGRCDCKFFREDGLGFITGEDTGCCESRQVILLSRRLVQALKDKSPPLSCHPCSPFILFCVTGNPRIFHDSGVY